MNNSLTGRLMGSRAGTIALGIGAAALAAVILIVYLNGYRDSVRSSNAPVTVLVAKSLIPKGTSGSIIATKDLFQTASVAKGSVKEGALTDPAIVNGRVALADIYPGQQLTVADFSATTTDSIPTKITGVQRAIALPISGANALAGHVQAGDRVDVYVGLVTQQGTDTNGVVGLLSRNVLVLSVPSAEATAGPGQPAGGGGSVVLQVKQSDAPKYAYASQHGQLWLVLRPQSGAKPTRPLVVNADTVLFGLKPVPVRRAAG